MSPIAIRPMAILYTLLLANVTLQEDCSLPRDIARQQRVANTVKQGTIIVTGPHCPAASSQGWRPGPGTLMWMPAQPNASTTSALHTTWAQQDDFKKAVEQ